MAGWPGQGCKLVAVIMNEAVFCKTASFIIAFYYRQFALTNFTTLRCSPCITSAK
jgi:hypothetical protein